MPRSLRYAALPIAGLCLMAACELVGFDRTTDRVLIGPSWQLVAFQNATGDVDPVSARPPFNDVAYTVAFTEQPVDGDMYDGPAGTHRAKVIGYPNQGGFTYALQADRALALYFHGTTYINQPDGSRETTFFRALDVATRYQIDGDRLRIAYDDGKALLFEAKASESD